MDIFGIILALALCMGMFFVIWGLKGKLVTPASSGEGVKLAVVVAASGEAKDLEQVINALMWLRESGRLEAEIIIEDIGLLPEANKVARLLAQEYENLTLCRSEEISSLFKENKWTEANKTSVSKEQL